MAESKYVIFSRSVYFLKHVGWAANDIFAGVMWPPRPKPLVLPLSNLAIDLPQHAPTFSQFKGPRGGFLRTEVILSHAAVQLRGVVCEKCLVCCYGCGQGQTPGTLVPGVRMNRRVGVTAAGQAHDQTSIAVERHSCALRWI